MGEWVTSSFGIMSKRLGTRDELKLEVGKSWAGNMYILIRKRTVNQGGYSFVDGISPHGESMIWYDSNGVHDISVCLFEEMQKEVAKWAR